MIFHYVLVLTHLNDILVFLICVKMRMKRVFLSRKIICNWSSRTLFPWIFINSFADTRQLFLHNFTAYIFKSANPTSATSAEMFALSIHVYFATVSKVFEGDFRAKTSAIFFARVSSLCCTHILTIITPHWDYHPTYLQQTASSFVWRSILFSGRFCDLG